MGYLGHFKNFRLFSDKPWAFWPGHIGQSGFLRTGPFWTVLIRNNGTPPSWYFVRVNRVFQGVFLGTLIFKFQNLSPPRVFMIFTRGFRRHKGADIAKKTFVADF